MTKLISSVILVLVLSITTYAQVGIDNAFPDSSAVLDLSGPINQFRGLLIPQAPDKDLILQPHANGLLVFDTVRDEFFFWHKAANEWYSISSWFGKNKPHTQTFTLDSVAIGREIPEKQLHVQGSVAFEDSLEVGKTALINENLKVDGQAEFSSFGVNPFVPPGGIIIWTGSENNVPEGWAICNGQNGTPDLRSRFVVGAGSGYGGVGVTGGRREIQLSIANLPRHTHTGKTDVDGYHNHFSRDADNAGERGSRSKTFGRSDFDGERPTSDTEAKHRITHTLDGQGGVHSHNFETDPVGLNSPFDSRPEFYAVSYIMRLP